MSSDFALLAFIAYVVIAAFIMGLMAVDQAQSHTPDPLIVIPFGLLWPLTVALLAGVGFYEWSEVFGDE